MKTNITSVQTQAFILQLDSSDATLELVGGKGASLARLATAGLPVPPGFQITTHAYRRFINENHLVDSILSAAREAQVDDSATLDRASEQIQSLIAQGMIPSDIADLIRQAYAELGSDDPPVAVRSSATAEDLPEMSFAGQQETYLNVHGNDNLLEAVKRCWASLWTARAIGYRARSNIPPEDVALAVVVQKLVPADAAGILFTANPVTGERDRIVINAAWGLGEAIVGGHVTPDTFVVNKQTAALESQEIADKEIMTVRTSEGTSEEAVPSDRRKQSTLSPNQAVELSRLGMQIEQLYGQPMDLEWAMQNGQLFILQARPITALPEPRVTLDWKLPRAGRRYARGRHAIELMPDPLSPLFATLALPLWEEATLDLGQHSFYFAERLIPKPFFLTVNDYAYYDLTISASQIAGMMLSLPRMIPYTVYSMSRAEARWTDGARPHYAAVVDKWIERDVTTMPATQLLASVREIVRVAANYYLTVETGILPNAYSSELLFTNVYTRFIKRNDDPPALTFMLGFDSAPIQVEKSLYDIAVWARTQPNIVDYLTLAASDEIATAYQLQTSSLSNAESWREFCRRLAEHLKRFGHVVYDLDFAKSLPADDPAPLIETLKYFLAGEARSPYERQSADVSAREQATQSLLAHLKGIRWRLFRWLVERAQRYAPLREDALADVGMGWPLVRHMLLEIGQRLVIADAITKPDDIFWLKLDEVQEEARARDAGQPAQDYRRVVSERRATWERERKVTPPFLLPLEGAKRFMGIDLNRKMPGQYAHTGQATTDTIKGFGASPGRIVGTARVIYGPDEFSQMRKGDILVAKIPTPAWTPLFALASGIVTDFGGPLSHSSIVAREYHIPAVLGTGVATERIQSGQRITVDGDKGLVTTSEPRLTLDWKRPRPKGSYWRVSVIELLPDPLSPLFATLGLPAWNVVMHSLAKPIGLEDLDSADLFPEQMLLTINDYAYYDYGLSAKQSARLLLLMPRLIKGLLTTAQKRWAEEARPRYAAVVSAWAERDLPATPAAQLLEGAREIVRVAAEHYLTVQSGIIPIAGGSEWLFTLFYNRLIKRKNEPSALVFMLGFDSAPIRAEKLLYDLAMWARVQPTLANYLTHAKSTEIAAAYGSSLMPIDDVESWSEFIHRFQEHLNRFGHAVYDLDFAKSVPAEDPAPLLETLKYFLAGQGHNPYERQAETASAREKATQFMLARLKGLRLKWFAKLLRWAQRYAPLREDALADVGLGWPVLRRMLQEIGRRLTQANAIAKPDDVHWLKVNELENAANALDTNQPIQDFRSVVTERRATWERERMVTPPVSLPLKGGARLWGIDWSNWMPAQTDQAAGDTIKGIGASPGRVDGVARVIHGPNEFNQMGHGDILVAKITTPAWTPLFALASGVVTDVGGLLSHSSIVAREYHIPAVLGTGVATERIRSGQRITVEGDKGVVTISEPRDRLDWKLPGPKGKYVRINIIELLPDPLSPLFATLGLPAWNVAIHGLGKRMGLQGWTNFMPAQLYLTINDYAYLDYGFSAKQYWHFLLLMPRLLKRVFTMARERWAEEARPQYAAVVGDWGARDLSGASVTPLLHGVREIARVAAEHYLTIQSGILQVSKYSETLFPFVYNRLIKRKGDPPALVFMLGFDSMPMRAEKSLYEIAMWARGHSELADYLKGAASVEVVSAYESSSSPISDAENWREFSRRFDEHLKQFGHAIYDLDFAKNVLADDPAPLLETLKYFLAGQARSPYERQAETASAREQATQSALAGLKGFQLRCFTRLLRWAQDYALLREDALANVGLGWPVLRRMLREIGRRLVDADAITKPDDVFWLKVDELENAANALDANQPIQDFRGVVTERRAKWDRERTVTPPVTLPIKGSTRFLGINWSFLLPAHTDQTMGNTIKGIGASPGRIVGVARVIHGPDEFNQMQPKDILVAKITTPAWTPLFALASGVVTDVGGLLSHSSIVAREYHIPAVLGTGVATERIQSGQRITVDGDGGVVTIER